MVCDIPMNIADLFYIPLRYRTESIKIYLSTNACTEKKEPYTKSFCVTAPMFVCFL